MIRFGQSAFSRRFVWFCEFAGYFITLAVFAFVGYSFFATVDVFTKVNGDLTYAKESVQFTEDVFLVRYLVEQNSPVERNAPVCEIVKGKEMVQAMEAAILGENLLKTLPETLEKTETVAQLKVSLKNFLSALQEPDVQVVPSPVSGIVSFERLENGRRFAKETPIFNVFDSQKYHFVAEVSEIVSSCIRAGQRVIVTSESVGRLTGTITSIEKNDKGYLVEAVLIPSASQVNTRFSDNGKIPDFKLSVEAKIATGTRRLFFEIFARRN